MMPVELSLVRLALFELKDCIEVPYKVVLDEYIQLAKQYGATDGYQFVNGILDKLAKAHRQLEYESK